LTWRRRKRRSSPPTPTLVVPVSVQDVTVERKLSSLPASDAGDPSTQLPKTEPAVAMPPTITPSAKSVEGADDTQEAQPPYAPNAEPPATAEPALPVQPAAEPPPTPPAQPAASSAATLEPATEALAAAQPTPLPIEPTAADPRGSFAASLDDLYVHDVSSVPPSRAARRLRPVKRVPVSSAVPTPIESTLFIGHMLAIARPTPCEGADEESANYPFGWHFRGKTRLWELRYQGRFKAVPSGTLYAGMEISDFDYSVKTPLASRMLAKLVIPLFQRATKAPIHFSYGDRGVGRLEDPESLSIVCPAWAGFDQVIVTEEGAAPPDLASDLTALGARKNNLPSAEYLKQTAQIAATVDTHKTYTFCVWGCSRFGDVMNWMARELPLPRPLPLSWPLYDWPAHMVCYELSAPADGGDDGRHCESRKRYLFDTMVHSKRCENYAAIRANLEPLYEFLG